MSNPTAALKIRDRLALAYDDGSFTVLEAEATIESAMREADHADVGVTDPAGRTRVLRVTLIENEEIARPAPNLTCVA